MRLLNDKQLKKCLTEERAPINNLGDDPLDLQEIGDQVQPCSVDLRVDEILIPRWTSKNATQIVRAESYDLEVGQSVGVTTIEAFDFPNNLAGLVVAPARITRRGILVLDTGHIDPGFKGNLSFTLINMGQDALHINRGLGIATVLLFELDESCEVGLMERRGEQPYEKRNEDRRHLAIDFLNIEERAKWAANLEARRVLGESGWKRAATTIFLPALLGIIFGAVTYMFQVSGRLSTLEGQMSHVVGQGEIQSRVTELEAEIKQLKEDAKTKSQSGSK